MAPLHILILADIPPFVLGGAEMQSWRLARAWHARGHRITIAGHRLKDGEREGIELVRLPARKSQGRAMRAATYFGSLARFLLRRQGDFDLVYCRFLGEAALSVALLKQLRLIDLPLVAVPAAGGNQDKADVAFLRSLPFTHRLVALLNRQCNGVNYIAPCVEDALQPMGVHPCHVARIPNGIDTEVPPAPGPQKRVSRLLFVGRLTHQKGLDLLLPVLKEVAAVRPDLQLTLMGDGDQRPALERQVARLGLEPQVRFKGHGSPEDVAQALSRTHLFILPSRYEGLSNAGLEALAQGVPCLLGRCGGLDHYLDATTGWVFDPHDPEAMKKALFEALSMTPEQWRHRSAASRALVRRRFDLDAVAQANLQWFQDLLAAPFCPR